MNVDVNKILMAKLTNSLCYCFICHDTMCLGGIYNAMADVNIV